MNYNWNDVSYLFCFLDKIGRIYYIFYLHRKIQVILKHFTKIVELKVCFNLIHEIDTIDSNLIENLKLLDLESNPIKEWKHVLKLGELKQ